MITLVKMIGMEKFSKTPYQTNKQQPIVFMILNFLISFIKKEMSTPNDAAYPMFSINVNPILWFS